MTRYVVARVHPDHFRWMTDRDGLVLAPDFDAIAALNNDLQELCEYCGKIHALIRGMVAYSHATPSSGHVHLVLETPIAWRVLRQVALPVLFEIADKEVALAQVRASNVRIQKLMKHVGFRQVAVFPGGYKQIEDLTVYRLDRDAWRKANGR